MGCVNSDQSQGKVITAVMPEKKTDSPDKTPATNFNDLEETKHDSD
jgi:hypothetical protein